MCAPSGIQITRNWPVRKPDEIDPGYGAEQGIMYPGLWMGFGWIDGNDYCFNQLSFKGESWQRQGVPRRVEGYREIGLTGKNEAGLSDS